MEVIEFIVDAPEFTLAPIGDVQLGVKAFDGKLLEQFLADTPEGSYFIGLGDYIDGVSPSNRALLRAAKANGALYDTVFAQLEHAADLAKEDFFRFVDHTVGKWVALLDGHHYYQYTDEETTDTQLAEELETTFVEGDVIIDVKYNDNIERRIHAWHGQGGAQTPAGVYNKMRKKDWANADLYLMGHTHMKFAIPGPPRVDTIDPHGEAGWHQRETWYVNTGSYLRGYMRGSKTYVEAAGYPPTHLGGVHIRFDSTGRIRPAL